MNGRAWPRPGARATAGLVAAISLSLAACGGGSSASSSTVTIRLGPAAAAGARPAAGARAAIRHVPLTRQKAAVVRALQIQRRQLALRKPAAVRPATHDQSQRALACLSGAGLTPVAVSTPVLWSGYAAKVGGWVYVQLYTTPAAAARAARALSPEEVATSGSFMVRQAIARYAGSPVPAVATCLTTGRPTKPSPPSKQKEKFSF